MTIKQNDRVRSDYNEGTVKSVSDRKGTVTIHWDGFAWPTVLPAALAATFAVVGFVAPEPEVGPDEPEPIGGISCGDREDFHSDG